MASPCDAQLTGKGGSVDRHKQPVLLKSTSRMLVNVRLPIAESVYRMQPRPRPVSRSSGCRCLIGTSPAMLMNMATTRWVIEPPLSRMTRDGLPLRAKRGRHHRMSLRVVGCENAFAAAPSDA
jgi:hypothetical protein